MPESREEIIKRLEEEDARYTEQYINDEALIYLSDGIYDQIAELLNPPQGGTHVNFCSGPFFIEAALRERRPDLSIAGTDVNTYMIRKAQEFLRMRGIKTRSHLNGHVIFSDFLVDQQGSPLFRFEYPLGSLDVPDFLMPGGPIEMIQADVSKESVIEAILNGRQLDSASFSFLGNSRNLLQECHHNPTEVRELDEQASKAYEKLWKETEQEILRQMSKYVKHGGEIILGGRFGKDDWTDNLMRRNKIFWTPDIAMRTEALIDWGDLSSNSVPISLRKFIRNQIPYSPQ